MKRILTAALAAFLLLALPACGAPSQTAQEPPAAQEPEEAPTPPPEPTEEELEAQEIEDLLSSLTTEEKVGQLFFVRCPAEKGRKSLFSKLSRLRWSTAMPVWVSALLP